MTWENRRWLGLLIGLGIVFRLPFAAWMGLGNDEAYHALFVRHPALSYFDHPPMLMVIESFGMVLLGQTPETITPLGQRLGFLLLFAGSTWLMARLTSRLFEPRAGFFAALALNLAIYTTSAVATFSLPDGPLLLFWLLTMDRLSFALHEAENGRAPLGIWSQVGIAWGLAMLSKYHAVFLPLGAVLYLLLGQRTRKTLVSPGPWAAAAIGMAIFSPVIVWNANHQWASFLFQGGRALGGKGFQPLTLLAAIGGQVLYLTPWIWFPMMIEIVGLVRHPSWLASRNVTPNTTDPAADPLFGLDRRRFLLCLMMPPLVVFLAVAARTPVLPHWSLVGLIAGFPLLGRAWAARSRDPLQLPGLNRLLRFAVAFVVIGMIFVTCHARWGWIPWSRLGDKGLAAAKLDATLDQAAWKDVVRQLRDKGWAPDPSRNEFLFTSRWFESGQLANALRDGTPVLCYHGLDSRSFADWGHPDDYVGRTGILINQSAGTRIEPACFESWFESIEPLGTIEVVSGNAVVRTVHVFRCHNQRKPFPFDRSLKPSSKPNKSNKSATPNS